MKKILLFTVLLLIVGQAAYGQGYGTTGKWDLQGNYTTSGTSPFNYLGTMDAKYLRFIVDSIPAGVIDLSHNTAFGMGSILNIWNQNAAGTGIKNTAIGDSALSAITSGSGNVALGYNSLLINTSGAYNTAIGSNALVTNYGGNSNTACGYYALNSNYNAVSNTGTGYMTLYSNRTGTGNTAMGYEALYHDSTSYITGVGYLALYSNTTGINNVATGNQALYYNVNGSNNTATASYALFNNTTGSNNTAIGADALYKNSTGSYNTATGNLALFNNTINSAQDSTGSYNTANGFQALYTNTWGYYNTATGYNALYFNTTGSNNTADGRGALENNTTGYDNTATGLFALQVNTTGAENTASGDQALKSSQTGNFNTGFGSGALAGNTESNNTAVGADALVDNIPGSNNTATGYYAGAYNIGSGNTAVGYEALISPDASGNTGYNNTAVGIQALGGNTSGYSNTGVGDGAGINNTMGNNNTFVGEGSNVSGMGYCCYSDASAFGYDALVTTSNMIQVGDNNINYIGGQVGWTTESDGRIKKNIKQNVPGLAFINELQPVTYNFDLDAKDKIVQPPVHKDLKGNPVPPSQEELTARATQEKIVYTGFVAQDVEKAAKSLNYDFSAVHTPANSNDIYGLRYAEFVVPLVKSVQELSVQNDSLKQTNTALQSDNALLHQQLNDINAKITQIESAMSQCCNSFSSTMQAPVNDKQVTSITDQPRLDQNIPNPFNGSSYISYYIPSGNHNAALMITDNSGHVLKTYTLSNSGSGTQTISSSEMTAGMYQYSLLIDGKLIDTKKMVLAK